MTLKLLLERVQPLQNVELLNLEYSDYELGLRRIENFARSDTSLLAFGTFGEVKDPPISDLDIFVCYTNESFNQSRKNLIDYIKKDASLSYMCWHDPLIIPHSMLSVTMRLHSLYNLVLNYDLLGEDPKSSLDESQDFLSVVWATYLIPIFAKQTTFHVENDLRSDLLILKNVHQAIKNLSGDSRIMEVSSKLRAGVIDNSVSIDQVREELFYSGTTMLDLLSNNELVKYYAEDYSLFFKSFRLNKFIRYKISDKCGVKKDSNVTTVFLSKPIWCLLLKILNIRGRHKYEGPLKRYMSDMENAGKLWNNFEMPYPFATPFAVPAYPHGLRYTFRKSIGFLL